MLNPIICRSRPVKRTCPARRAPSPPARPQAAHSAPTVRSAFALGPSARKFILPGLIDAHCHISLHQGALPGARYTSSAEFCTLWAAHAIGRVLRAGVTSIAVPGGKWFTDVTVREAVDAGLLEGPRMVVAARALSNYGVFSIPTPIRPMRAARLTPQVCCATRAMHLSARPASSAGAASI